MAGASEIVLSTAPLTLRFVLTRDADFAAGINPLNADGSAGTFASGDVVKIVFGDGTAWSATVTTGVGSAAMWGIDKALVNARIDSLNGDYRCSLRYQSGTIDRVWATGRLTVSG